MSILVELEKEMESENLKDELIKELVNVCYDALRLRGLYDGIVDPTTFRAEAKEYVSKSKEIENNIRATIQKAQNREVAAMQFGFITNEHWELLTIGLLERVKDGLTKEESQTVLSFIQLAGGQVEQTQTEMMTENALPPEKLLEAMLAEEAALLERDWVGLTD